MSSRNKLLDKQGRCQATAFNQALRKPQCDTSVRLELTRAGFQVDYVETRGDRRFGAVVVSVGQGCDSVRLIDNVVLKLLNLVKPDRAYFGKKDYQQYLLVRDMCSAFF